MDPLLPRVEPLPEVLPEVVVEVERCGVVVVVAERCGVVDLWGTAEVGCVERVVPLLPRCDPSKVWGREGVVVGALTFLLALGLLVLGLLTVVLVFTVVLPEREVPWFGVAGFASPMW